MSLLVCWGKGGWISSAWGSKWGLPWVCFAGLVVGGNYVWYLVVVVIFMGHEGVKRRGKLWSHRFGWQCKPQGGTIFMGKRDSHYVILLHWNFILSYTGCCKLFYRILYTSFPYITAVLHVLNLLRLARPKVPFKVS